MSGQFFSPLPPGQMILHLDLDTFFVSVERLQDSSLNGKPVIVGGWSDRAVVSGCSYEARAFGVHSGMPMKMARTLCSDAVVIRGDMEQYSKKSRLITDIIAEKAPLYEKASIDEFYLDVSGMDRFFGTLQWSKELRKRIIQESGLPISFGLSVNKTVAKIATGEAKPNGELEVVSTGVKPFLSPLSIRKIPMVGEKTYRLLRSMGVATIGILGEIPPEIIRKMMGTNGLLLWKKANGLDNSPVVPQSEAQSLSNETTFENDTTDMTFLNTTLGVMTEHLAFRLRKRNKLTGCITVKIRYADFETHTLQKHIPYTSFDHLLLQYIKEMFARLYSRRLLVRLVGIRFSDLVSGNQQLHMFDDTPEQTSLYQSMDRIRLRFGEKAVRHGTGMLIKTSPDKS